MPSRSGWCVSTASMKSSGDVSTPEVDDLEARAAQHHDAEVLADVVQVALDGAHHDLAGGLDARLREDRLDVGHAVLHRPGAGEHLGHVDDVLAELDADDAHRRDEAVVHDLERRHAVVEGRPGQRVDRVLVALDERHADLLHPRRRLRVHADHPRALVGALDELVDLAADRRVGDVGQLGHRSHRARGRSRRPRASRRPCRGSREGSRSASAAGSRTRARPSRRRRARTFSTSARTSSGPFA